MSRKLPFILFVFSLMLLSYGYGVLTVKARIPPYSLIKTTTDFITDQFEHWTNDLGLSPTRHLVAAKPGRSIIDIGNGEFTAAGFRLIAGFMTDRETLHGAMLFDELGREVHFWPIDYAPLDPGGRDPENVYLHGIAVLEDGSLVVNFDGGNALARVAACGEVVWVVPGGFHHVVSRSFDGTIWTLERNPEMWKDEYLTQINPASGDIIRRLSLIEDIIRANDTQGIFDLRTMEDETASRYTDDPFHTNDIEILSPDMAEAFPLFEAGDMLISLRSINLVAVIDGDSLVTKWWRHGPWHRQHDPDFVSDGTISVFNNNMNYGVSEIVRIDPETGESVVSFRGEDDQPFYTWIRGTHEVLTNGNTLITVSQDGRAIEVDASGRKFWEFNNIYDESHNGIISRAMHLSPDFFDQGALDCVPETPD